MRAAAAAVGTSFRHYIPSDVRERKRQLREKHFLLRKMMACLVDYSIKSAD